MDVLSQDVKTRKTKWRQVLKKMRQIGTLCFSSMVKLREKLLKFARRRNKGKKKEEEKSL
jgi:hypothetical protein